MPGRCKFPIVSSRNAVSDKSSPKYETAQKQSEGLKTPSREGACLARAAAYVLECLGEHLPACDTFQSRPCEALLSKVVEVDAGQHDTGIVRKGTTYTAEHTPHVTVALALPVISFACYTRAQVLRCQSSNEPRCPLPNIIAKDSYTAFNETVKATLHTTLLTTSQMLDGCLRSCQWCNDVDFPSTPVSPASPHEDGELAHWAPANAKLPDVVDAQQPSLYTVINKQSKSTYLCSPEPSAALMPLIPKPAILQASCHLLLSIELGWRACSKPPDTMGTEHQPNINIIINKADADVSCLPTNGAVIILPNSRPMLAYVRAANPHRPNNELISRVHKPPNMTAQRPLPRAINGVQKGR
jgi:hypothetical protein